MNKFIISGNVVRDPEEKEFGAGKKIAKFTVAVRRAYKQDGEYKSDFVDVTAWDKTAEFVLKYINKGAKVLVDGEFTANKSQDGLKTYWNLKAANVEPVGALVAKEGGDSPKVEKDPFEAEVEEKDPFDDEA